MVYTYQTDCIWNWPAHAVKLDCKHPSLGPYLGTYIKAPKKKPSMEQKLLEAGKDCRLQIGKLKAAFAISWPVKSHYYMCIAAVQLLCSTSESTPMDVCCMLQFH